MTYDASECHFFIAPEDPNGEPSLLIVGGIDEPFAPAPKSRLGLNLANDRERIEALLDKLVSMYQTEERMKTIGYTCTGAAAAIAVEILKDCGGKVVLC